MPNSSFTPRSVVVALLLLAFAAPAQAESVSLYCVATSGPAVGVAHIVNVDYATSRVTWGNVEDEGTRNGSHAAEITDRVIAWEDSDSTSKYHLTINRHTGGMLFDQSSPGYSHIVQTFKCSPRRPAEKPKF